jgi:CheY-like chemotaxis protein
MSTHTYVSERKEVLKMILEPKNVERESTSDRSSRGKRKPTRAGAPGTLALNGQRVLLIEDMPDARTLFLRMITRAGAEILAVDSVTNAWKILEYFVPDVIISDIGLPDEDGISFMNEYRNQESGGLAHTPSIALTAFVQLKESALRAGFDIFLTKPTTSDELIVAIIRALSLEEPVH